MYNVFRAYKVYNVRAYSHSPIHNGWGSTRFGNLLKQAVNICSPGPEAGSYILWLGEVRRSSPCFVNLC